ncbi:MAG: hypothetical protein EKK42_32750 [Pseudonocardiaceae bacterium]|nr:MAG: hypothetical protein EKK42_32750 [Pseudonocardiaceae bacterium]
MSSEFENLKLGRINAFNRLKASIQPTLGSHKTTRLSQAGCREPRGLLHDEVASKHARMLSTDLKALCGPVNLRSQDDFRFLTILHAVSPLDCGDALMRASKLKQSLQDCLAEVGARCLGVVEFEIVSLALLRKIKDRSSDENRKLDVLENIGGRGLESGVLVHFHGVLDLSSSSMDTDELRQRLLSVPEWKRSKYQVEIKQLHSGKPLSENLQRIAAYLTKGGNETLRYNPGFGRDPVSQLDAQIWRGPSGRADKGADTIPDERGLTIGEIQILDRIWLSQMATRDDNRGYVFDIR